MKTQHKLFSKLFLVLSFGTLAASAQEKEKKRYEFWKERSVSQSYNVSSGDKLSLSNQFGKVEIKTWNRNEVKVDIHIETSATNKEANDEMFQRIEIKHGKDGNTVFFKTDMDSKEKGRNNNQRGSNNIQIDYAVYMPASLALDLKHRFGKSTVPDLSGRVNIDQQFGEVVAGNLSNPGKIDVRFSKASFAGLKNAKVDLQFANAPVIIRNATGDLDLNVQHSKSGVTIYTEDLNSLDVKAQFSDIGIVVGKNASANFDVKTHFGSMNNTTSYTIKSDDEDDDNGRKRYGPKFNYRYRGSVNGGKMKINLDGNFTEFYIGHEAPTFKKVEKRRVTSSSTI